MTERGGSPPRSTDGSEPGVHPILTASPFLYFALDREGFFRGMNPAAEAFFGHASEELLGRRRVTSFLHADDRQKAATAITAATETSDEAIMLRVRWPNGHIRIIECQFRWDGESGRVLAWARDTTESHAVREELQARIELLQDLLSERTRDLAYLETFGGPDPLFRRIPLGILRVDEDLRILAANPEVCRILGAEDEETLRGRSLGLDLFAFEREFQRLRASLQEGERLRGFLGHLRRSGELWIQARFDANPVSSTVDPAAYELYLRPVGSRSGARERPGARTSPRPRWASNPGSLERLES